MINSIQIKATENSIAMDWSPPPYTPQRYNVDLECFNQCGDSFNWEQSYFSKLDFHILITNLDPAYQCMVHFTAVYNPVSLDHGLYYIVSTLTASKPSNSHIHIHTVEHVYL